MEIAGTLFLTPVEGPAHFGRLFSEKRRKEPVYIDPVLRGHVILRHADVSRALRDYETFSSRIFESTPFYKLMIAKDGPEHTRLRRMANQMFAPRALKAYEESVIVPCAEGIVDRIVSSEHCDLLDEFCLNFPMAVLSRMVGSEEKDLDMLHEWIMDIIRWINSPDADGAEKGKKSYELACEHLRSKVGELCERPVEANLLSQGIEAMRAAGELDYDMIMQQSVGAILAGLETTAWALANALGAFLTLPEVAARVRADAQLIMPMFEEAARWSSASVLIPRLVIKQAEIGGVSIPPGNVAFLCVYSAAHDEEVYDRPEVFDLDRRPEHMLFGGGPHFCLGAPLARLEARIGLGMLLARCPNLRLAEGEKLHYLFRPRGSMMFGPESLNVNA
jgi:cytochrome P450